MKRFKGFTLIELLIVVAIIAILAAIAVPNFLEAQVRAKVSRAKNDERALGTALEAYYVDYNEYPQNIVSNLVLGAIPLSTPVAYITNAYLIDPFGNDDSDFFVEELGGRGNSIYFYLNVSESDPAAYAIIATLAFPTDPGLQQATFTKRWLVASAGPDRLFEQQIWDQILGDDVAAFVQITQDIPFGLGIYDPTNGTVSRGDISRTGKNVLEGGNIN